jgi:hypothetical protein
MPRATQVHYDAMLRMMKYVDDMSDRGLVPNPKRKWNGKKEHKFIMVAKVILTMQKICATATSSQCAPFAATYTAATIIIFTAIVTLLLLALLLASLEIAIWNILLIQCHKYCD